MEDKEDTLERELKLRPFTTGDVTAKNISTTKLLKRSEARAVGSIVSSTTNLSNAGDNHIRPRAPRTRLPGGGLESQHQQGKSENTIGSGNVLTSTNPNRGRLRIAKDGGNKKRHQKGTQNITELWDSLNRFSVNNMGRMRASEEAGDNDIHYINVNDEFDGEGSMSVIGNAYGSTIGHAVGNGHGSGHSGMFMQRQEPIETLRGGVGHYSSTTFSIPELPRGKRLTFNVLSTWGDPHYLGLMGIEIFDNSGHLIRLSNPLEQIWAIPADINVLPEYNNDPRTVDNLLDGVNHTCDDLHAWLTPFTSGQDHLIMIDLDEDTTISMIRIWNYNKSRIHSYRGARYVEISFDNLGPIFKGEVSNSCC